MCGFSGLLTSQKFEVSLFEEFKKISKKFLHHRGPDSSGEFFHTEKIITLTHTRLAILDLSKEGFQPMESVCKNYVIVFNGEIYNHLDLRKKYGSNHKWRGSSDTETLLYCFAKKGVESILKECMLYAYTTKKKVKFL
jgi:asparagine synthase (glutamine-hydrolysing)